MILMHWLVSTQQTILVFLRREKDAEGNTDKESLQTALTLAKDQHEAIETGAIELAPVHAATFYYEFGFACTAIAERQPSSEALEEGGRQHWLFFAEKFGKESERFSQEAGDKVGADITKVAFAERMCTLGQVGDSDVRFIEAVKVYDAGQPIAVAAADENHPMHSHAKRFLKHTAPSHQVKARDILAVRSEPQYAYVGGEGQLDLFTVDSRARSASDDARKHFASMQFANVK